MLNFGIAIYFSAGNIIHFVSVGIALSQCGLTQKFMFLCEPTKKFQL